jgi:putative tryptophan/tyrosine transport system substrate-binding protein
MYRLILMLLVAALVIEGAFIPAALQAAEKKIGLMWVGSSGMAKRVMIGFVRKARQIDPDLKTTTKMAIKNMDEGAKVFRDLEATMDGVVFLRSNGAKFLGKLETPPRVPCFVGGCNNPAFLGAVKDLNAPEGNITGVTYFIPYEKRFQLIMTLFPDIKSVALLMHRGHPGSPIDRAGTRAQCSRLGLAYSEVIAGDLKELMQGAKGLAGKVDLFILSSTSLVLDNAVSLLTITNPTKTPMFSYSEKPVKNAAVAALAARDEFLGGMLAESVVEVVANGKPVSQVPVKTDPAPLVIVNVPMMKALGLQFPQAVMSNAKRIE